MKKMTRSHETGHFMGSDDTELFFQSWSPENPSKTKAENTVLVFIHGMAEHSDRYQFPVDHFTPKGYTVYAMDLRGHGKSNGQRAYAESMGQLTSDVRAFIKFVRGREKKKKIFIVGHSFGGQIVINYTFHHPTEIEGVLVSSPNLRLKLPIPFIKRIMAPFLSKVCPRLPLGNELDASFVSHDKDVVEAYEKDPQILRKITARLGDIVLENYLKVMDLAEKYKAPIFMMHAGDDLICCPSGTKDFFAKIAHKNKTLKIYDGFYHEIFNEIERDKVFRDMEAWLEKQS